MNWFKGKQKKGETIRLLKTASGGFSFGAAAGLKARLLSAVEERQMREAEEKIKRLNRRGFKWPSLGLALASLLLAGSLGFQKSGALDRPAASLPDWELRLNQVFLRLPLPQENKADIRADIVDRRTQELEQVLAESQDQARTLKAVEQSQASLSSAVTQITQTRAELLEDGKAEQAEKLNTVLERLETLAEKQAEQVEKAQQANGPVSEKLSEQLEKINQAKERAGAGRTR